MITLLACTLYRSYPTLPVEVPQSLVPASIRNGIELTGVAWLANQELIFSAEGDAGALYSPGRTTIENPQLLNALDFLPLSDQRPCGPGMDNCIRAGWQGGIRLLPQPIHWTGETPFNLSDIAAFGLSSDGNPFVLGITEFSSIGRRTGAKRDYLARSRQRTERLVLLERREGSWAEQSRPELRQLQAALSNWGRSQCEDDLLVEGLSVAKEQLYIGVGRCNGPVVQILNYSLADVKAGRAVVLKVVADGIVGGAGPEERITGLSWDGSLWAVTAWDSYGYETEPVFGGRLHRLHNGKLKPVREDFVDRPSGLWAWASSSLSHQDAFGGALVTFDADDGRRRPDLTIIRGSSRPPADGRFVSLYRVQQRPRLDLGLNGFDFEWYSRDHRLSQWSVALARQAALPPGAWTQMIGGLWQLTVGAGLGLFSNALPGHPAWAGHNRQAVALTDLGNSGLEISSYRASLSVVPLDREVGGSVAELLKNRRQDFQVATKVYVGKNKSVFLQGFSIDTTSRADRGICLAAIELGADILAEEVVLRAMLIGGICNDFDLRGPELRHGRTTNSEAAVEVMLDFAVVEGGSPWSVTMLDPSVPPLKHDKESRDWLHCSAQTPAQLSGNWKQPTALLRGFTFAFDPDGFDSATSSESSLRRNNYLYRYLLRAFGGEHPLVEGGLSHGLHPRGPMRDASQPSALLLNAELIGLDISAPVYDIPRTTPDPNLLPEDGSIRWAIATPLAEVPSCSPH